MKNKYTVLMLYPDYATNNYGEDTFLAHVEARALKKAVRIAQGLAFASYLEGFNQEDLCGEYEDFKVLAIFEGHLEDLAGVCE